MPHSESSPQSIKIPCCNVPITASRFSTAGFSEIIRNLRVTLFSRIVGERRTEAQTYLPSYHTESMGLMIGEQRPFTVSLLMNNIFDVNYEEELGFSTAGRSLLESVEWNRDKP
ncbi:hypothetical protein ACFL50_03750 [Candidatus Latescibacterota bacterium]